MDYKEYALNNESPEIIKSLYNGDWSKIQLYIRHERQINEPLDQGWPLLHLSVLAGQVNCLKVIIKSKHLDINIKVFKYYSALFVACKCDEQDKTHLNFSIQTEIIKLLLDAGINVNDNVFFHGICPLNNLIRCGNLEAVKMYIENGGNVKICDNRFGTPIHTAVIKKRKDILNHLLTIGAKDHPQHNGLYAIHSYIYSIPSNAETTEFSDNEIYDESDKLDILLELLNTPTCLENINKGCYDDQDYTPLLMACMAPHHMLQCIKLLLDYGANPNCFYDKKCPFYYFIFYSKSQCNSMSTYYALAERLLNATSVFTLKKCSAIFHYAMHNLNPSLFKTLLEKDIYPDEFLIKFNLYINNYLCSIIRSDIFNLIFHNGLEITPIGMAAFFTMGRSSKYYEMAKILLDHNSTLGTETKNGKKIICPLSSLAFSPKNFTEGSDELSLLLYFMQNDELKQWLNKSNSKFLQLYTQPLFTASFNYLIALLKYAIPLELILDIYQIELQRILNECMKETTFKKNVVKYVIIVSAFTPLLPKVFVDILDNSIASMVDEIDIIEEYNIPFAVYGPKTLSSLCVFKIRKLLFLRNNKPLFMSIEDLCNYHGLKQYHKCLLLMENYHVCETNYFNINVGTPLRQ